MYFANIRRVCASIAGKDPIISIIKGTKNHSKTKTRFLNQLIPFGRLGRIVQLKATQIKLVKIVNLNNNPAILGKL